VTCGRSVGFSRCSGFRHDITEKYFESAVKYHNRQTQSKNKYRHAICDLFVRMDFSEQYYIESEVVLDVKCDEKLLSSNKYHR